MKLTVVIYPRDSVEREIAADFAHEVAGSWTETETEVKFALESNDWHTINNVVKRAEEFRNHSIAYSAT